MKLNIIAMSCLIAVSGLSQAQTQNLDATQPNYQLIKSPQCSQKSTLITTEQARDIGTALLINNLSILQHFLVEYCVDNNSFAQNEEGNPMYLARSNDAIKYLLAAGIQPFTKLNPQNKVDMLTYFMLDEEANKKFIETSDKYLGEKLKIFEKKFNVPNLSKVKSPFISYEEREKILTTLLAEYKRTDFYHKDALNNNISTYAMMTSEPEILGRSLTLSPNLSLVQKNKDGLSLLHIAMLPKHIVGNEAQKKSKNTSINNFIMANINDKNLSMTRYEDLNYVDFVSLMKNNNPDLYSAIITKFPSISPNRFNEMTNEEKTKATAFFNSFDYIEKMKKNWGQ